MDRLSTIASLVALAIFATVFMFLTALIFSVLGPAAIYFVWFVCVPVECILLCFGLVVMVVTLSNTLYSLKLRRKDEEHLYQVLGERREIDLEKRKLQLQEYRQHVSSGIYPQRRLKLRRRPDDWKEYGF